MEPSGIRPAIHHSVMAAATFALALCKTNRTHRGDPQKATAHISIPKCLIFATTLIALICLFVHETPPAQAIHNIPGPTNLTATAISATSVRLTWDGPAESYQYRAPWREQDDHSAIRSATTSASTNGGTHTFTGLKPNTFYQLEHGGCP